MSSIKNIQSETFMYSYCIIEIMKTLDDIDKKIIKLINKDWEQGTTKMGRYLGLSHTAVRSRLKRLKRDLIKVNCNINIEKLSFKLFLLCLDARVKNEVINRIKCCPKIISYYNTYGEYNFIMLAFAENTNTMESMIEHCFSFDCTDITKYTVIPIINSSNSFQSINFLSEEDKKNKKCDFKINCPNCESFKKELCVGCPLHKGYKGLL